MTKILIVDDEQEMVDSLRVILEQEGYDVDSASSAEAGLQKIRTGAPPDLAIIDVMMETMAAGIGLAHEIRSRGPTRDIPLIILSGVNRLISDLQLSPDNVEADRCIEKPYRPEEIRRVIRELLENRKRRDGSGSPRP